VTVDVVERHEMRIDTEDDIALVRRKVRDMAQACRFDIFMGAAVTTAASELARNVWVHAGRGVAIVERLNDDVRQGVRVEFKDDGPGIADLDRVLAGGFSTANSMGLGLSGSRRLVDEFTIDSAPGHGTRIVFVKWTPY
jgi:serine/threonine-protein kinase RsbT